MTVSAHKKLKDILAAHLLFRASILIVLFANTFMKLFSAPDRIVNLMPIEKYKRNMYRYLMLVSLVIMTVGVSGCGTTGKVFQAYPISSGNTNELVLLKVQHDFSFKAVVEVVDGNSLRNGKWWVENNTQQIKLLPGQHFLEVAYQDSNNGRSISNALISFIAEPRESYELHVAPEDRSFGKAFLSSIPGAHFRWQLWIIDAKTKTVVAGIPRLTPIHWYER